MEGRGLWYKQLIHLVDNDTTLTLSKRGDFNSYMRRCQSYKRFMTILSPSVEGTPLPRNEFHVLPFPLQSSYGVNDTF